MSTLTRRNFIKKSAIVMAGCGLSSGIMGYTTDAAMAAASGGDTLKLIHITDTHLDLGKPQTSQWLEQFVQKVNKEYSDVDLVLFGGDNFNNNVEGNGDAVQFKAIADELHCPYYAVRGNKESSPKPAGDPVDQAAFAKMFFPKELTVHERNWKLKKGGYTILGLDSTIDEHNNGLYTSETLVFVEEELTANPKSNYILLNHHAYLNYWHSKDGQDIHKYVLNNAQEVQKRLFGFSNLKLTLSGHKHRNDQSLIKTVETVSTVGFKVPVGTAKDHQFRLIEMANGAASHKIVGIV